MTWAGNVSHPWTPGLETPRYSSLKPSRVPGLLGSSQSTCMAVWFRTFVKKLGAVGTVGTGRTGTGHMMDSANNSLQVDNAPPPLVVAMTVLDCWLAPRAE